MIKHALILGAVAATTLAGCSPTTTPSTVEGSAVRQCFFGHQMRDYKSVGRDTIHLEVDRRRVFVAESVGACDDFDTAISMTITSDSGGNAICTGDYAKATMPRDPQFNIPCRVRIKDVLTLEQAKAAEAAAVEARRSR